MRQNMKKYKITEDDITIVPGEVMDKIFDKASRTKEGRQAYAEEMELFYFMESINNELKRRHMSRYALAKNAGINPFVLSRAMENIDDAKYQTLKKMANGLGKTLRLQLVDIPGHKREASNMAAEDRVPYGKPAGKIKATGKTGRIFQRAKKMLKAEGAERVAVFGSYATGKQTRKSDLDLLVSFKTTKSLLEHASIERKLSAALGLKVDLITEGALSPHMAEKVHKEMIVM
jgi:uncharacterized protein